ncbi:zinc finger BED domain-containing protein RICESLEEPER 1-like [Quercus lobata]|uniref:zinc finger BED domain-containing protein RICESLEEPER 1-like n=1 Tax=Quercus lobata TaxID=97700 RepID=UPI0012486603|nr:zinc finger BED domain-containing protein RICESLEEPER 1-like [Quercus lobata]
MALYEDDFKAIYEVESQQMDAPAIENLDAVQCIHCLQRLAYSNNGATTQYHRYLKGCLSHKLADKKQKQLAVNEGGVESEVAIANFKYDRAKVREKASHMILVHEYPFNMMEQKVFNVFMKTATPYYQKISHNTARNDCISTFELEKKKLKIMLGSVNRVSFIADFWKSGQKIGYMWLTCHFVDSSWKLQKRIINFCDVPPPHFGDVIFDAIFKSLLDWGLENKVCTITLDNANNNDAVVRILKDAIKRKLMLGGKIFHVRCCAYIINLLVQDELSEIETVIENVRESVKYLIASEARLTKFGEIAKQLQLLSKKLILDCPTSWNATYAMLVATLESREVFPRYKDRDAGYNWLPSNEDWDRTEYVCNFLLVFEEVTNVISGSEYLTANIFLAEVWKIKEVLNEKSLDENDYISAITCKMKLKFDKYWGEWFEVARNIDRVHDSLYECYNEYVVDYTSSNAGQSASKSTESSSSIGGNNSKFKIRGRMEFD